MRVLLIIATLLLLAGCMGRSPEQRFAEAGNACTGYGFQPGTQAYAECMMRLDTIMQQQDYQRQMAMAQDMQQWADSRPRTVTCNTYNTGGGGNGFYPSYGPTSTTTCQ